MYSKKNGYTKFYNKQGKMCKIKSNIQKCIFDEPEQVIISFRYPDKLGERLSHIPRSKFKNVLEVIRYIVKNLETDGMIFEISQIN